MEALGVNITVDRNATNGQIVQTVVKLLPIANKQMAGYVMPGKTKLQILAIAQTLPASLGVTYKADGWNQKVQLPSSLLNTKVGDCKSFSLLVAGFLNANNISNGLIFVGYKNASHPSHVYNFAYVDGKTFYIDSTIEASRIQSTRQKETLQQRFMNLSVIAGADVEGVGRRSKKERREQKKERKENRREKRKERGGIFKRAAMAPARAAFLSLLLVNPRGIANRTLRAIKKNEGTVKKFWNRLGGDFAKLKAAAEKGAKKRKVSGIGEAYPGVGFVELLDVAGKIVKGIFKLFEGMKVDKEAGEDFEKLIPEGTEDLGDLEVTDPDPGSNYAAQSKQKSTPGKQATETGSFQPSTGMIILGAGLLGLLLVKN